MLPRASAVDKPSPARLLVALTLILVGCASSGTAPTATPLPPSAGARATTSPERPKVVLAASPFTVPPTPSASVSSTTSGRPRATASATGSSSDLNWPTYGHDNARTAVAPAPLTFTRVNEAWRSPALDGDLYAAPIVVGDQVIVATENNSLYSFERTTGRQIWRSHVGEPMSGADLPCGNISTSGITGTPAASPDGQVIYAVSFVRPGRHELVAVDRASGAARFQVPIDPPGSNPLTQQERAALVWSRGAVYVAFGGLFGDCGAYHGWVVAANAATGAIQASYQVPTEREGGIWAPPGPSVDATGNLYVATGNGSSVSADHFDYGDAVLKLSPDLRLLDWFAPANWAELNRSDGDVGSTSPALLPDDRVFQIGKAGIGYLLRADGLGHIGGQIFQGPVCSAAFGGVAVQAPRLYIPCTDGLVAVQATASDFRALWRVPGFFAGPPIVAAGAVWTIERAGNLIGVDPLDGRVRFRARIGEVSHFSAPSASGPYLFVAAKRQVVAEKRE